MKLTAENYNKKISVDLPDDSDLYDVMEAFQTLVLGMTFHPSSWDRVIMELAEECRENMLVEEQRINNSNHNTPL